MPGSRNTLEGGWGHGGPRQGAGAEMSEREVALPRTVFSPRCSPPRRPSPQGDLMMQFGRSYETSSAQRTLRAHFRGVNGHFAAEVAASVRFAAEDRLEECATFESGRPSDHQTRARARTSTREAPASERAPAAARTVAPVVMTSSTSSRRLPATSSTT